MQITRPPSYLFLRLLVKPFILSLTICFAWAQLYLLGIHFPEPDESAFTDAVIPALSVLHALFASVVIGKVWNEYQQVKRCVRRGERDEFKDTVQNRLPRAVLLLLLVLSFLIQTCMMLLNWSSAWTGFFANFCVAFSLSLVWEVATNLDNPRKAVWYVNQIPPEWMKDVPK